MTFTEGIPGRYHVTNSNGVFVGVLARRRATMGFLFWPAGDVRLLSGELAAIIAQLDSLNCPRQPAALPEAAKPPTPSEAQHFYQARGEVAT